MPAQELAALKQITNLEDDAEAIVRAAREFLRISRLQELKGVSGKVELAPDWQGLEELELNEARFPQ
jgi:hypothetical protein